MTKLYESPVGIKYLNYLLVNYVISNYYTVNPRVYHNETHIKKIFDVALAHKLTLSPSEELALLFHDAIYVPGSSGNETSSVHLMHSLVGLFHVSNTAFSFNTNVEEINRIVSEAGSMIICTRDHEIGNPHVATSAERVIDLDLYGLATPEFQASTELVWREYKGTLLASNDWNEEKARHRFNAGRIEWIARFLKRKSIFKSKQFFELYEEKARENLKAEAQRLLNDNMPV